VSRTCDDGKGIKRSTTAGQYQDGNLTENVYLKFAIIIWIATDPLKNYHVNNFSLLKATKHLLDIHLSALFNDAASISLHSDKYCDNLLIINSNFV
jgi:hypothetical protein